ncbi:hypothetical protein FRC16_008620 [Serendipita sp. 398]|nr:hypothetical protein FRC16_008620 [Serendipita sp. 398]
MIVTLDGAGSDSDDLDIPEHCWVIKLANTVTYDRMDHAVERMSKIVLETPGDDGRTTVANPLIRVLFGLKTPSPPEDIGEIQYFNPDGLNDSQKEAVKLALSSPEIALIHGPPGTGKTHTLVEVILQLASQKKRILVCGASNLAVDNLLERLVPHKIPLTRIGHPARVLNELHSSTLDFQAQRSDQAQLVNDIKKEIEELMSSLTGTTKGKKVRGAERKKMYEEVKQLRKEYRKREASVVSRVVDDAKIVLATCHGAGGKQLINRYFDVYFESVETAGTSSKAKGVSDEGSKCNTNEVEIVKRWVEELVSCGVPPAEVAIVTPYQAQVTLLSASLSAIPELEIGTVDGMQGREKDAIVISLVRSNDKREVGFLKERRRLNVAMTRARKHLCVVGDSSTIKHGSSYLKKWMEWLEENADIRYAGDQ